MNKGPLVGEGFSAEVFAWGEGQVLKLFHHRTPEALIQCEADVTRIVHQLGLAVPSVGEIIAVDGRTGIVYERIVGASMLHTFSAKPWLLFQLTHQFVALQVAMHGCVGQGLPTQRKQIHDALSAAPLASTLKEQLYTALQGLPDGDRLCHGDYHPDNILLSARGPVTIDWTTATQGNPLADAARTLLLISTPLLPLGISTTDKWLIQVGRKLFYQLYRRAYQKQQSVLPAEIGAWIPIQAAMRLVEERPGERAWLMGLIEKWAMGR